MISWGYASEKLVEHDGIFLLPQATLYCRCIHKVHIPYVHMHALGGLCAGQCI